MRLICPNCGAHYAIDPRIIPVSGRDVQCSACSHTWFQIRDILPEVASKAEPKPDPDPVPPRGPRREVDPDVMSVLREEAERERRARDAERSGLEVQASLDLPTPPRPMGRPVEQIPAEEAAAMRDAAMAAEAEALAKEGRHPDTAPGGPETTRVETEAAATEAEDEATEDPALRPAPRRRTLSRSTLLPDIDEINSTLEASAQDNADALGHRPEPPSQRIARARRGQGRRVGFALACFAFGLATVLYAKGPSIGAAVPAFAPYLEAYVANVQDGRVWLDALLRKAGSVGQES